MRVKIVGYGWVGKAMHLLFPDAVIHDLALGYIAPETADVAFICVPTPSRSEANHPYPPPLDCSIVEQVVREAEEPLLIVRSTVMPGFCDGFDRKIVYQPEYLGETVDHPLFDMKTRPFLILGGSPVDRACAIELYQSVYNADVRIREVTNLEAEIIKLSENRAIAFKVAQCQELYDVCQRAGVNYNTIREAVYGDDPRFNLFWTFVYPEKRGFNSKCLPKDVYAWAAWAESVGISPILTSTMLAVNHTYIRETVDAV